MEMEQIKIFAEYRSGCFCDRPKLGEQGPYVLTQYRPRFTWREGVRELASKLGAFEITFSNKEKKAVALLPFTCSHRDQQVIGFDRTWTF